MFATICSLSSRNQNFVCAQLHCVVAHRYPTYSWRRQLDGTRSYHCPGCSWSNGKGGRWICDSVFTRNWDHSLVFADNAKWWTTCQNSCNLHFAQLLIPWRRFALCLWYCWEILCSGFRAWNHGRDSGKSTMHSTAEIRDFMLFAFMRPPSSKRSVSTVFPSSIDVKSNFGSSSSINLLQLGRHIKMAAPTNRVTFRVLTGCFGVDAKKNRWIWTVPKWVLVNVRKKSMEILDAFKGPETMRWNNSHRRQIGAKVDAKCWCLCLNYPKFGWSFFWGGISNFSSASAHFWNHSKNRSSIVVTYRIVDFFSHCRIPGFQLQRFFYS